MYSCVLFVQNSFICLPGFTDELFCEGLEECDMEHTITGMLVVRQLCFQGPHLFISYADWFQVRVCFLFFYLI